VKGAGDEVFGLDGIRFASTALAALRRFPRSGAAPLSTAPSGPIAWDAIRTIRSVDAIRLRSNLKPLPEAFHFMAHKTVLGTSKTTGNGSGPSIVRVIVVPILDDSGEHVRDEKGEPAWEAANAKARELGWIV
jgi:hypothetical protein